MKKQALYFSLLLLLAVFSRIIAPWPNFTAMTAVAVTGGMLFGRKYMGILFPILALFVSDLIINNTLYAHYGNRWLTEGAGWLYGSYLLIALLGSVKIFKSTYTHVLGAGLIGAILFYLITNFGAWLGNPMYPQSFVGLLESYTLGLPFLMNQVLGTLAYGALIILVKHFSTAPSKLATQRA